MDPVAATIRDCLADLKDGVSYRGQLVLDNRKRYEAAGAILDTAKAQGERFVGEVFEAVRLALPIEREVIRCLDHYRVAKPDPTSPWFKEAA